MKNKRLKISILAGTILGVCCIIGIGLRMGFVGNELFLLSTWINRIIMGLVIGLLPFCKGKKVLLRGAFFGLIISGSFYITTNFIDTPGFIAGIAYSIIIDYTASKYTNK